MAESVLNFDLILLEQDMMLWLYGGIKCSTSKVVCLHTSYMYISCDKVVFISDYRYRTCIIPHFTCMYVLYTHILTLCVMYHDKAVIDAQCTRLMKSFVYTVECAST